MSPNEKRMNLIEFIRLSNVCRWKTKRNDGKKRRTNQKLLRDKNPAAIQYKPHQNWKVKYSHTKTIEFNEEVFIRRDAAVKRIPHSLEIVQREIK